MCDVRLCAVYLCVVATHIHTVYCEKFSLPMWKRRRARKMLFLNGLMHIHTTASTFSGVDIPKCIKLYWRRRTLVGVVKWCMRCTTPASCSIIIKKKILNENSLTSFWRNQFADKCLCEKKEGIMMDNVDERINSTASTVSGIYRNILMVRFS